MKNFDDPADSDSGSPGEPAPAMHPIFGDTKRLAEALQPLHVFDEKIKQQLRETMSALRPLNNASERALKTAIGDLAKIELPKLDTERLMRDATFTSTVRPRMTVQPLELELPKPPPRVVPAHILAVAEAVNRQIDATEMQTDAILALHDAIDDHAARSEALADERAARSDNRAAWGITFAGLAALIVVIEFFFR